MVHCDPEMKDAVYVRNGEKKQEKKQEKKGKGHRKGAAAAKSRDAVPRPEYGGDCKNLGSCYFSYTCRSAMQCCACV